MHPIVTPEQKQHSLTLNRSYRHNLFLTSKQQQDRQSSQVVPSTLAEAVTAATATVKLRSYLYQKSFSSNCSSSIIPLAFSIHSNHNNNDILRTIIRQRPRRRLRRRIGRSISSSSGSGNRSTCCSHLSYYKRLYFRKSLLRIRRRRKSRSRIRIRDKKSSTRTSAPTSASHSTSVTPARGRSPPAPTTLTATNIIPAMTVHEKGDFITLRGANPQTGYISPSIISLQNTRFGSRFGSRSNSNSNSNSHSNSRSRSRFRSNSQLNSCHTDSLRKTPTSPGEALHLFSSRDDGCATQCHNSYMSDAFAVMGERNFRVAGNTQTFPSEGSASTESSSNAPQKTQSMNTYSANSPTFDPFITPMPSAENPQPYNAFVTMPTVPALVDKNSRLGDIKITQSMVGPQSGKRPITSHQSRQKRRPLSPHNEAVELNCALPSSTPSPQPPSALTAVNALTFGNVRRKPVASPHSSYENNILSSTSIKEANKAKVTAKQASAGKEGPKKFLEKLKLANKQGIRIRISSKPENHSTTLLHRRESQVLLIDKLNPEKLYSIGWRLAKALSVLYLLWLTIRILFALRQILDVALVPLRIVIIMVAWFFRR